MNGGRGGGRTRVAAVSYVNAWPLIAGLDGRPDLDLVTGTPAEVADLLRSGQVAAGLVPSIELLRQPGLEVIGSAGISAFGPVDSVMVLLRRAPHEVRTLALDPASRTSQVLAAIVFEHVFGVKPEPVLMDPALAWDERTADAVLVIGDRALAFRAAGAPALDLADQWSQWTALPFVFAVWAARAGARDSRLAGILDAARERGRDSVEVLARRAAALGPLDEAGFQVYLSRRIRYGLGEWEKRGLARFLELAASSEHLRQPDYLCST